MNEIERYAERVVGLSYRGEILPGEVGEGRWLSDSCGGRFGRL